MAIVAFSASTQVPRRANLDRNDEQFRPRHAARPWPALATRSMEQSVGPGTPPGAALRATVADAPGRLSLIETRRRPSTPISPGARSIPRSTAAFLAIEGPRHSTAIRTTSTCWHAQATGWCRRAHFVDTAYGGSAHGVVKGGLTAAGRDLLARMESSGMIIDVAHASAATIDDVLSLADPSRRRLAHRRPRRRAGRPQPARRPGPCHRRDRRPRRYRLLDRSPVAATTRPRSLGRSSSPSGVAGVEHVGARIRLRRRRRDALSMRPGCRCSPRPCLQKDCRSRTSPR